MAILSHIEDDALVVRSVGDQDIETGMAQLNQGLDLAEQHFQETGVLVDLLFDMIESEESKETNELKQVVLYLAQRMPPLSGRIALAAPADLMFGLSRIFAAHAAGVGIDAEVFRSQDEAWSWLRPDSASMTDAAG